MTGQPWSGPSGGPARGRAGRDRGAAPGGRARPDREQVGLVTQALRLNSQILDLCTRHQQPAPEIAGLLPIVGEPYQAALRKLGLDADAA